MADEMTTRAQIDAVIREHGTMKVLDGLLLAAAVRMRELIDRGDSRDRIDGLTSKQWSALWSKLEAARGILRKGGA